MSCDLDLNHCLPVLAWQYMTQCCRNCTFSSTYTVMTVLCWVPTQRKATLQSPPIYAVLRIHRPSFDFPRPPLANHSSRSALALWVGHAGDRGRLPSSHQVTDLAPAIATIQQFCPDQPEPPRNKEIPGARATCTLRGIPGSVPQKDKFRPYLLADPPRSCPLHIAVSVYIHLERFSRKRHLSPTHKCQNALGHLQIQLLQQTTSRKPLGPL